MLSRMLLHVVASAGSVDFAAHARAWLEILHRFDIVDDLAIIGIGNFVDVEFGCPGGDRSGVEDLSAASGIEGGAVENQRGARVFDYVANFGVEVVKERVLVVEA